MLYFKTRKQAREFAKKRTTYSLVDCGNQQLGRRWAVKVLSK